MVVKELTIHFLDGDTRSFAADDQIDAVCVDFDDHGGIHIPYIAYKDGERQCFVGLPFSYIIK